MQSISSLRSGRLVNHGFVQFYQYCCIGLAEQKGGDNFNKDTATPRLEILLVLPAG